VQAVTQAVVLPNIEIAIRPLVSAAPSVSGVLAMPQRAAAACLISTRLMLLRPAISTTDGINVMSLLPTCRERSFEATVLRHNFGTPRGTACMAARAM